MRSSSSREGDDESRLKLDIRAYGEDGRAVALFKGVTIHETSDERLAGPDEPRLDALLYHVAWRDAPRSETGSLATKHWCLLADADSDRASASRRCCAPRAATSR